MTNGTPSASGTIATLPQLKRATLWAAIVAAALLVIAVLPAEYGIDPTGIGRSLRLTRLGEAKRGAAANTASTSSRDLISATADGGTRVSIVIAPYASRETKGLMKAGDEMRYEWSSGNVAVAFDFHGETADMSSEKSYEQGIKAAAFGTFKAPFAGRHGWNWENRSPQPVTISITAWGAVEKFAPIVETATVPALPPSGGGDAPYLADMPMRPFMERAMQTAAENLWAWQGYVDDEKGFRSLFPKNDAEWAKAENASLLLAEMTNDLLIPGRRIAEPDWDSAVLGVRKVALKAAAAAAKKSEDDYMTAALELDAACEACHLKYNPAMQKQGASQE